MTIFNYLYAEESCMYNILLFKVFIPSEILFHVTTVLEDAVGCMKEVVSDQEGIGRFPRRS